MDERIHSLIRKVNNTIDQETFGTTPEELYDPIRYIMSLGGKRLRPLFTLLAFRLFNENDDTPALRPATGVETFHNFTLMHDDLMDEAPLRRGKETVHKAWDSNIAILSGDVMLVKAYKMILDVSPDLMPDVLEAFTTCASRVCEGQQTDMNFEKQDKVTTDEYLKMIRLKTAELLGFALELGGILGRANKQNLHYLRAFGLNLGTGFQLKDDLLDVYGNTETFGKQIGGDIKANKKTYLLIKAFEKANRKQQEQLTNWLEKNIRTQEEEQEKIQQVTELFNELNIYQDTTAQMDACFREGLKSLENITGNQEAKTLLHNLANELINREK